LTRTDFDPPDNGSDFLSLNNSMVVRMHALYLWLQLKASSWGGIADLIVLGVLFSALAFEAALALRLIALLRDFSKHKNAG
jgi:hypothetical protein